MQFYSFEVVIEKEPEDEGYFAYSPTLPGCFGNGKTIEETKKILGKLLPSMLNQSVPTLNEFPNMKNWYM